MKKTEKQNSPHPLEGTITTEEMASAPKTTGEKMYDRNIATILFGTTYVVSIVGATLLKKTKLGYQKIFKPLENWMAENITSKISFIKKKPPAEQAKWNENVTEVFTLGSVGSLPAIPFKYIENNRDAFIDGYNERYGTGLDDPGQEMAAQARIDTLPKQTWAGTILSRIGVILAVSGTMYVPKLGSAIGGFLERAGASSVKFFSNKGKWFNPNNENIQYAGKMAVADLAMTVYSTFLMIAFARFLAPILGNTPPSNVARYAETPALPQDKTEVPIPEKEVAETPVRPLSKRQDDAPDTKIASAQIENPLQESIVAHTH